MAAIDIRHRVAVPVIFERREFVLSFIIFLLFAIIKTMAINTGEINPYKIAVYNNVLIGLISKKSNETPTRSEIIIQT